MTPTRTSPDRINLWFLWTLASTAGVVMGFFLSYAFVALGKLVVPGVNEDRLFGAVMYPALVLGLTALQWLALRRYFSRAWRWVALTLAGWLLAGLVIFAGSWGVRTLLGQPLPASLATRMLLAVVAGGATGLAQWVYFRERLRLPGLWIASSVLGWMLALIVIGKAITNPLEMALLGAIPGAVTGLFLAALYPREEPDDSATVFLAS